ncbi:MAG: carotenoid oxygenase family protein [Maricaulis sp.]|uniref:carotenoid oxygenase family protein n=1 Tax=Maricaulis sp. TaxID=1486257 RepID=UPI001B191BA6|nr:carotenoid oxygenase family protein [Maricaulis sp.]MBO6729903.1 carotenoid oxygenase family protein [Maricaulis sp.]MBO6846089.1 carotenoid oxygenase family protein [Maricaulis sp.]MBO6876035.1 carotenoid oxygenase family protein [Maricaulis sp.]
MSPNRRDTLKLMMAGPCMAGVSSPLFAQSIDPVYAAYEAASAHDPWTLITRDAPAEGFDSAARRLHGSLPDGLRGTLFRNGPGRFSRQEWRYRHWFDGDGFIQSWTIGDEGVRHRGRFVQTDKWRNEEAAGRFLVPALGSVPPNPGGLTGPDDMNVANTSVMMLGDELLALWEGGSAWSLDPDTLASNGARRWGQGLDGVPFSAHPKREPGIGIVWNFGQDAMNDRIILWKISPEGELLQAGLVPGIPGGMIHDFVITERSLVFLVGSFRFDQMRLPFIDSFSFRPDVPMIAIAIDKNDWTQKRVWEMEPGFLFHFGGAWEDADGTIRLDAALSQDARFADGGAYAVMRGEPVAESDSQTRHSLVTLRNGRAPDVQVFSTDFAEFPQVDMRFTGRQRNRTWTIAWRPEQIRSATRIESRDLHTGQLDSFDHGDGIYVEEPLFIPAPDSRNEGEGWIIHTALNTHERRTELHAFNALKLSDGPVVSWQLDHAAPFGFHGCWRQA